MSLRLIPNLTVIRPADAAETLEAWKIAINRKKGPVALILTRQSVPLLDRSILASAQGLAKGGYILWESSNSPRIILMATGSETQLALEAGKVLEKQGLAARVVSMPCISLFDEQTDEYKDRVLPPEIFSRISIEAGIPTGWEKYTGLKGKQVGISSFGISAPGELVYKHFGLTVSEIVEKALKTL
jgi:transketolase